MYNESSIIANTARELDKYMSQHFGNDYEIIFAYVVGEERQLAEIFGIPETNPNTGNPWLGSKGIPLAYHGEFWLSRNGWYISFEDV
jgi:hypothetical protein